MLKITNDIQDESNNYSEINPEKYIGNATYICNNKRIIGNQNCSLITSTLAILIPSIMFFIFT